MIPSKFIYKIRHSSLINFIQRTFPTLFRIIIVKPVSYFRFNKERLLAKEGLKVHGEKTSVLFFTTHKSASTFLDKIFNEVAAFSNYTKIDFDGYFTTWDEKLYSNYSNDEFLKKAFITKGIIYGPFRNFVNVPKLEKYKIIVLVRDPRDVLVSSYYSYKFSHLNISKKNVTQKKELSTKSIDEFVQSHSDYYLNVLNDYYHKLLERDNTLLLRYEDMVKDYEFFLTTILEFIDVTLIDYQPIIKSKFKVSFDLQENKLKHVRKATPGEYRGKLDSKTIEFLNFKFQKILKGLGYD